MWDTLNAQGNRIPGNAFPGGKLADRLCTDVAVRDVDNDSQETRRAVPGFALVTATMGHGPGTSISPSIQDRN